MGYYDLNSPHVAPIRCAEDWVTPERETWMGAAVCVDVEDPNVFFLDQGEAARPAKRICGTCPVAAQCLEYALTLDVSAGVWGGLTPLERARLRQVSA